MTMNITTTKPRTKRTAKEKGFYQSGAQGKAARRDSGKRQGHRSSCQDRQCFGCSKCWEGFKPKATRDDRIIGGLQLTGRPEIDDDQLVIIGSRRAYTSQSSEYARDRIALRAQEAEKAAPAPTFTGRKETVRSTSDAWRLTANAAVTFRRCRFV